MIERCVSMEVDVSVVIPLYNKGEFIRRSIVSVLDQAVSCSEIIVIDDGSDDGGPGIVEEMARDDGRIRLIRSAVPRSGPSCARNLGIRESRAKWIAFLDADDVWSKSLLRSLCNGLREHPTAIGAFSSWSEFRHDDDIDDVAPLLTSFTVLQGLDFVSLWLASGACPVWTSASIFSRRELIGAGCFPVTERRGEDKDTWLRLSVRGAMIKTSSSLSFYRVGVNGQQTSILPTTIPPIVLSLNRLLRSAKSHRERRCYVALKNLELWHYAKKNRGRRPMDYGFIKQFHISQGAFRFAAIVGFVIASRLKLWGGAAK